MTLRRLILAGAILVAVSVALTVDAHAKTRAQPAPPIIWPDTPCNLEHRMDIAIVDGLFFECTCVRLQMGHQCDWMIIAGVSSAKLSRRPKHHRAIVHAHLPAVTA